MIGSADVDAVVGIVGVHLLTLPDRSSIFGLVKRCHVNARPIRNNILPYSPPALSCKRGLSLSVLDRN